MFDFRQSSISDELREFIRDNFPRARQNQFGNTVKLLQDGIIDSMGLLIIISFIEEKYNVFVQDGDLTLENFESIEAISKFISCKLEGLNKH